MELLREDHFKTIIQTSDHSTLMLFYLLLLPVCELCRSFFTTECSVHGPPVFIPDTPVPMGVIGRAIQTLPPGLEVRESSIPVSGLGVFNKGDVIPVGVHFGPYQGDLVDREEALDSGYSWVVSLSLIRLKCIFIAEWKSAEEALERQRRRRSS